MKKHLYLLLLSILTLGCSSSDDSVNIPNVSQNNSGKLKTVRAGSMTINYTYTQNGIESVEQNNNGSLNKQVFVYQNGKVISKQYFTNGVLKTDVSTVYQYQGENISKEISVEDGITFVYDFTYNSLGQMIKKVQHDDGVYRSTETFTYTSTGNIMTGTYEMFMWSNTEDYFYDDKANPYYQSFPAALSKIENYTPNNSVNAPDSPVTTSYQYNVNNQPVKRTTHISGLEDAVIFYEYY